MVENSQNHVSAYLIYANDDETRTLTIFCSKDNVITMPMDTYILVRSVRDCIKTVNQIYIDNKYYIKIQMSIIL